ncbi:DE-cadherin [Onthophagus taurus]|uniref:DE-cadherin n=1 Tax=Onthophagus taurus TaxID=166361 RepID=UPI000C2003D8|nr:DE-cadherin [Onthophagus taurus]
MHRYTVNVVLLLVFCCSVNSQFDSISDTEITEELDPSKLSSPHVESSRSSAQTSHGTRPVSGNNHKPTFVNCSLYSETKIYEEQKIGTYVTTMNATDNDPPESGGTVTYAIVHREGVRKFFNIDSTTGVITTAHVFDRDEPTRQKEVYITVKASDNGWPVLADICILKITILDINDNYPIFDKSKYDEKVTEDAKVDREVMRVFAYDADEGDNARLTYSIKADGVNNEFNTYFQIDQNTGVINLKESVASYHEKVFNALVLVQDNPINITEQKSNEADITIKVVDSNKQLPSFVHYPKEPILIYENFSNFEEQIINLTAQSNIDLEEIQFDLLRLQTAQSNKDNTFKLTPINGTSAYISLGRQLDYETVTEYTLTVKVINKDSLHASTQIHIKVADVNDEIPAFIELVSGSVLENEEIGTRVMQVRAIDRDGTSANNIVSYELQAGQAHEDKFAIEKDTGIVTTKIKFDREAAQVYDIIVLAKDNSPSALYKSGEPNIAHQTFRITIEDKNDNPPVFEKSVYRVNNILESTNIGVTIAEVRAIDQDTAAIISYTIRSGNDGDSFDVERTTGRIVVKSKLDYEKIQSYNLTVEASDGSYSDKATVLIFIDNINDELPVFEPYDKRITDIVEETIPVDCIIRLTAYDPDIQDRNAPQNIEYQVDDRYKHFLSIDKDGCVKLIKKLDRDKPNGSETYQAYIHAFDDGNSPNSQTQSAEIFLDLKDINDNAPFLTVTETVWQENQEPGEIITFEADDYDSPENGPPFTYSFAEKIDENTKSKFYIKQDKLYASTEFDREEQKYYDILIAITDSGTPETQTGVSNFRVIIGDVNDNPAQDGESEIFVYNYKGTAPDMQIGRVFVEDPDDWDLRDKNFQWRYDQNEYFQLDNNDGMLTMRQGTPENLYVLEFEVTEEAPPLIPRHTVQAKVTVTVKEIPEEAVVKSGSIRLNDTSIEEFITRVNGVSKKDILQEHLSKILNTSKENVDIFTVIRTPSDSQLVDVRFSAHGSPYYAAERLNNKISLHHEALEQELGVTFVMISISECMKESICGSETSCMSQLSIMDTPAIVFTNRTSFVGVKAIVEALCECVEIPRRQTCLNGGTFNIETSLCDCPGDFEGPNCEALSVGFQGNGWAMYPTFNACDKTKITLEVETSSDDGLIFYAGPLSKSPNLPISDFISLEINAGFPKLILNYGSGTVPVFLKSKRINDGASHTISIEFDPKEIAFSVDHCHTSDCVTLAHPKGPNTLLNVNGPLQVGGTREPLKELGEIFRWEHMPVEQGFAGCIRNLTYNSYLYDLGMPGEHENARPNCNFGISKAVTFGIDSNFLVAILVCVAILLILLLAVVVHRRKENNWNEKDNDDITETIIAYTDEGGENDAAFDMNFLKVPDEEPPINEKLLTQAPKVPDIRGFVDNKKDDCDRDPNNYPFDDVRYYAYEGDGNSTGSLSSLASCTDDGDLKFNYLSSFGPRFRKLADMYGEPSDEDSHDGGEESFC